MKQSKPSMQIISVNQNVQVYADKVRDMINSDDQTLIKNARIQRIGEIMKWSVDLVTRLAVQIQKNGDTWDNASADLLRFCEEPPPWWKKKS